jgi:choline dehydrogenase
MKNFEDKYDYVVIGAGSAGCAIAARLSEVESLSVLVLEAGAPDSVQEIHVPAAFPYLFKSGVDWDYMTVPQKGLNGRQEYNPRGKTLGGSSSINAMIFMRGNPNDYDRWEAMGNKGWSYNDLMPLFKKTQNQERGESEHHAVGGPINVANLRDPNPLSTAFVEAAQQAGYAHNDDFNSGNQLGFGLYQVTQKGGMRCSAAVGYLHPALQRPNLTAITEAMVTELCIEDNRCVGVKFTHNGEQHEVRANNEVILSGGSFNSPHLLMLSGIGPAEHLKEHGIAVKVDLPGVGQNLQDHMFVPIAFHCTQPVSLTGATAPEQAERFQKEQMGLLTSNIGEAGGFVDLGEDGSPEIQFHFGPAWFIHHGAVSPGGDGYTLLPGLVRPKSKGSVKLASANPTDKPLVDPNYLSDPYDIEVLKKSVAIAFDIAKQAAFDPYRGEPYLPAPGVQSNGELENYIRDYAMTIYHPVGTCKMGTDDDAMAVVNNQLQVRGVAGLRVADASIMPIIINGNSNIPSMVIGEKCAASILETLH